MEHTGFQDLVERAQAGDRKAMDEVLSILRPHLEALARSYAEPTRPAQSTADLLQEACLRAWRKLDRFDTGEDDEETFAMFRAWVGQIVRRLGMNARRDLAAKGRSPPGQILRLGPEGDDGKHQGGEHVLPSSTLTPSAYACADELAHRIEAALDELPDQGVARIVRMRFFDGLTIPEIAKRLGLSPDQVRERHRSAMRLLRRDLGEWA